MATTYTIRYRVHGTTPPGWIDYGHPVTDLSEPLIGLQPNTTYDLQIIATDEDGAVASSILTFTTSSRPPTAPGAPVPGVITPTSIVVNWSPSSGGSTGVIYQVMYRVSGAGNYVPFGLPISGTSTTITGLTALTNYDIEVNAINAAGSALSPSVTVRTLSVGSAPTAPTALNVTNVGQTQVTLNWTLSTGGTLPITYQPQYRQHGAANWISFGGPVVVGTQIITGLLAGLNYDFSVTAINSIGSTQAVSFVTQQTVSAPIAPSPPGAPAVTNITASGATASWTASVTGSAPITYQLAYRVTGSNAQYQNFGAPIAGTTVALTGLSVSTSYDLIVEAINAASTALSTVTVFQTLTPAVAPAAPTGLQVTNVTQNGFTYSWQASASGTLPITYQPQMHLHSGGAFANIGSPISGTTVVVTGLVAGTAYDLQVNAINSAAPAGVASVTLPVTTAVAVIPGQFESVDGTTVTNTTDIIYASKTVGVAQAAPPFDEWSLTLSATPGTGLQVTRNASQGGTLPPKARLISYLNSISGNHTLSGQVSHSNGDNINADTSSLGITVAIDVREYWMDASTSFDGSFANQLVSFANAGGIIGVGCFIPNLSDGGSAQSGGSGGVNASNVLQANTSEHNNLIGYLDQIAANLQIFKNAGIPVLWRPFHEMDGNWFWWGTGNFSAAQFIQMWDFCDDYLTITKGLDNLVRCWTPNGGPGTYMDRYPGDQRVDVVGMDAYTDSASSYSGFYNNLRSLAPSKPVIFGEFGFGNPGSVNPSDNAQSLVNDIKSSMSRVCAVVMWSGWNWNQITNSIGALNDPWMLNRGDFTVVGGSAVDTSTNQVLELYYLNHTIYHESQFASSFGQPGWWRWTGSNWTDSQPPIQQVESIEGTTITAPGAGIVASQTQGQPAPSGPFDNFTLDGTGHVLRNGVATTVVPGSSQSTTIVLINDQGGSLTTNTGDVITIAGGVIFSNGVAMFNSDGSSAVAFDTTTNLLYGQDAVNLFWFQWDGSNWIPSGGWTPAVAPPTSGGSRLWYNQPYTSASFWNCGIGSGATWANTTDADIVRLRSLNPAINVTDWSIPLYIGDTTDPIISFTNNNEPALMSPQQFHCPIGATPATGGDHHMAFYDKTQPGKAWGGFACTLVNGTDVTGGITTALSAASNAYGDGLDMIGSSDPLLTSGYTYNAGLITVYDIVTNGKIEHMLRCAISPDALKSPGTDWRSNLPWPTFHEDFNGPANYSGPIIAGSTFGIPASTVLTGRGLSTGGMMLATALQKYGCIWRDQGGTNQFTLYAVPALAGNTTVNQMAADMHIIVPLLNRMTNQAANRINGGGTYPTPLAEVGNGTGVAQVSGVVDKLYYHTHTVFAHVPSGWYNWQTATSTFVFSTADPTTGTSQSGGTVTP